MVIWMVWGVLAVIFCLIIGQQIYRTSARRRRESGSWAAANPYWGGNDSANSSGCGHSGHGGHSGCGDGHSGCGGSGCGGGGCGGGGGS